MNGQVNDDVSTIMSSSSAMRHQDGRVSLCQPIVQMQLHHHPSNSIDTSFQVSRGPINQIRPDSFQNAPGFHSMCGKSSASYCKGLMVIKVPLPCPWAVSVSRGPNQSLQTTGSLAEPSKPYIYMDQNSRGLGFSIPHKLTGPQSASLCSSAGILGIKRPEKT